MVKAQLESFTFTCFTSLISRDGERINNSIHSKKRKLNQYKENVAHAQRYAAMKITLFWLNVIRM